MIELQKFSINNARVQSLYIETQKIKINIIWMQLQSLRTSDLKLSFIMRYAVMFDKNFVANLLELQNYSVNSLTCSHYIPKHRTSSILSECSCSHSEHLIWSHHSSYTAQLNMINLCWNIFNFIKSINEFVITVQKHLLHS